MVLIKYSIQTLGCKVNAYESEYLNQEMKKRGYISCKIDENPNIIIINTCSVTNKSDAKSRHLIKKARRLNPDAFIVACGCSVENKKEELKEIGANILVGDFNKSKIPDYIEKYKNEEYINLICNHSDIFEDMFIDTPESKTRAFVKIEDGCNNYCSYCIIPYLRGNIRSKDINEAYEEIKSLVNNGHKEIVLTGIHTGAYGKGLDYDLTDLIRKISKIGNLKRIRISSIEITELNEKFLNELKTNKKLVNHMHVPLQSGSDLILKKMNRRYDTKFFNEKINALRKVRPNINITTDLIVGFPYETDEEFSTTVDFIKKIGFTKIHTFPFSLRNGTKAETMKEHFVKDSVKKERVKKILELSDKLEETYYKKFLNKDLEIIVEAGNKGHSENYILVNLDKPMENATTCTARITDVHGTKVLGKVID